MEENGAEGYVVLGAPWGVTASPADSNKQQMKHLGKVRVESAEES